MPKYNPGYNMHRHYAARIHNKVLWYCWAYGASFAAPEVQDIIDAFDMGGEL